MRYCARSCELEIRKVGERWLLHGRWKFLVGRGSLVAVRPLFRCSTNYRVGTARSRWNNRDYLPRNEKPGFRSDVSPDCVGKSVIRHQIELRRLGRESGVMQP